MTDLEQAYRNAEAHASQLMAEKDQAMQDVKDKYADALRQANADLATAQKALADSQAADALRDRPDGEALAEALGLTL